MLLKHWSISCTCVKCITLVYTPSAEPLKLPHALFLTQTNTLQVALTSKHTPVRTAAPQLRAADCSGAIMKGSRRRGGPADEERQVRAWLSLPEWPVSLSGEPGLQNCSLALVSEKVLISTVIYFQFCAVETVTMTHCFSYCHLLLLSGLLVPTWNTFNWSVLTFE